MAGDGDASSERRLVRGWFPARSRRERRDLREGSRSIKEVTKRVPFSTTVRNEKMRRERNRKVKRFVVKVKLASRRSCVVDRRWLNR